MSPAVKVGQLYMAGTTSPTLDDELRSLVLTHHVGSVLYLQNPPSGVWQTRLTSIAIGALAPAGLPILLAVDQEGGLVQRLTGPGFETIPRASQQAASSDAALRADWKRWGGQLAKAGVHYNLAPDADPVSADDVARNAPVGRLGRNYGTDPATTAAKVAAVVRGLADAGVASSAKHFPGLGRTTTNTDFGVAVDSVTAGSDQDLRPFRAAIEAGADSVMISSAIYTRIADRTPALFSGTVINDLLRGRLGFDKVVVSDDLGAAKAVAAAPVAERGTRFLAAGGDLVIDADPGTVDDMIGHTLARAAGDREFAAALDAKVARVLALKSSVGLLRCSG